MKDNEQGKARVKSSQDPSLEPSDKTRIAVKKRPQAVNSRSQDDARTVVRKPSDTKTAAALDATRIASRKPASRATEVRSDATRIAIKKKAILTSPSVKQSETIHQKPASKPGSKDETDFPITVPTDFEPEQVSKETDGTEKLPAVKNRGDVTQFQPTRVLHNFDAKTEVDNDTRLQRTIISEQSAAETKATKSRSDYSDQHLLKKRFVLERVLGAGGMGIVYKAKDLLKVEAKDRDPYVAIKVLSEEFKSHPEAFISLQRESRKSQRIAHPNIVNVHDFDRDGDTVFMTMEFLDGDPLDQLIRRYRSTGLPTDDAWEIIRGMTSALKHAHEGNIIHSDFKPGNVFVTKKGLTKVFDFGIARAVAKVEHLEGSPQDHTVFDAGNLGALTPAYASLEMLEGKEPDVRDDVYALGCVAYEVLTGQHPYNKVPADEAKRQGLKPKRISHIKKYEWQAIESAIAFDRENRLESVADFEEAITPKLKSSSWMVTALALIFAAAISGYFLFIVKEPEAPAYSEFDIRNELELKVRIDFYKENIEKLMQNADFSDLWQDSIWKDLSDLKKLIQGADPWVDEKMATIFGLYVEQIKTAVNNAKYTQAEQLIDAAKRYTDTTNLLDQYSTRIAKAREIAQQKRIEQAKLELERKQKLEQQRSLKLQQQKKAQQQASVEAVKNKQITDQFNIALDNVNTLLDCQGSINMRDLEIAIKKLKQLDPGRFNDIEKTIVRSLAGCIIQIGKSFPERAMDAKKYSLRLFSSPLLSQINIQSRDPCDISLAGLGTRGKRAMCKDKLKSSGYGPEMVVIPGNATIDPFAITKYEVSVAEFNQFCVATGLCGKISKNGQLPVSDISIGQVDAYLSWLSSQSGKKYRLPSKNEWLHAAKSRSKKLDPNRNCELSTRGFQKGGDLVYYTVGSQNGWGLVNYVGNVQEWVYKSGRKLEAVGGSFLDPMESCTISTSKAHNGMADKSTGFRVLREI